MALLIKTDGTEKEIKPNNGMDFSLEELQAYVYGYIEIINLNNGNIMVVNEEGKFFCDKNETATTIAEDHDAIFFDDYICGDVVLCKQEEVR